jgi:hypothetical protein
MITRFPRPRTIARPADQPAASTASTNTFPVPSSTCRDKCLLHTDAKSDLRLHDVFAGVRAQTTFSSSELIG